MPRQLPIFDGDRQSHATVDDADYRRLAAIPWRLVVFPDGTVHAVRGGRQKIAVVRGQELLRQGRPISETHARHDPGILRREAEAERRRPRTAAPADTGPTLAPVILLRRDGRALEREILDPHRKLSPQVRVEHRNGNTLDCRRVNLRLVRTKQSIRIPAPPRAQAVSGYRGVYFNPQEGQYRSEIRVGGTKYTAGYHTDPVEAARAYNALALIHHGQAAKLNDVPAPIAMQAVLDGQLGRLRGWEKKRAATHCARGHDYAEHGGRRSDGARFCQTCRRAALLKNRLQVGT